jgi:hypothetical protein
MTEKNEEANKRENEGDAGDPREESQCGHRLPGAVTGAGHKGNEELRWARRHVPYDPGKPPASQPAPQPAREVFRKTELHVRPPPAHLTDEKRRARRRRAGMAVRDLCPAFEAAFQAILRSLLERQDAIADDLTEDVTLIQERLEALDERLGQVTGRLDLRVSELEENGRWT